MKCKTFTLWQTGGAHVNMPDYAKTLVSACWSVLLGLGQMTDSDILHGTMWRIYGDVFMNARLGPTGSSERKGPLTPNDLAKESFVPLRQYSAHSHWRQSADLETLRRYLSVLRRACAYAGVMSSQRQRSMVHLYCTQSKSWFGFGKSPSTRHQHGLYSHVTVRTNNVAVHIPHTTMPILLTPHFIK